MVNDKGYITIIALFIMTIIFISALFLIYTSSMEYLIVNSSHKNIQAFYLAEGKIHTVLKKEEYYYEQLMPRMETYIKYGRLGKSFNKKITIDNKDLFEDDNNNIVNIDFAEENHRRVIEMKTHSTYSGITQKVIAKMTMINDIFEWRIPIVSSEYILQDRVREFQDYMSYLKEEIRLPNLPSGIMEVETINYEHIRIVKDSSQKTIIEFFRNNMVEPVKKEVLKDEDVFMLLKNNYVIPTLSIESDKNSNKMVLNGVLYIEGDLIIHSDLEFHGILILDNSEIYIDPSSRVNIEGIILLNNYNGIPLEEMIQIDYNFDIIRKYGIYLPKFIDPKIQVIKSY
ncbi:hypothetical protein [Clostridium sp. Cult1]|uniref:hypothetical protein n=1 Tax=Clostridium sp. Cult1 TaxID=2079002 RepID=UPI001F349DC2|nr:hypothetical protein [Clostridium sp. Cult1]MCF6464236.1 hypothetical protein [Clostridium sp. Cult1]